MADEMSLQEIATRLEELMTEVRGQRERLDSIDGRLGRIDGRLGRIDGRLGRIDVRLDSIETKADRGFEAFSILNDSMDRQFAAVLEKLDERTVPLEAAQRSTAGRVRRLETRRKRR